MFTIKAILMFPLLVIAVFSGCLDEPYYKADIDYEADIGE